MAAWLRRGGHGRAPDGSVVTWTLAEGRRGRRWREAVVVGEGIRSSLLFEQDPDGRFSHLELSTAAGLLTLHPEGDGTLHGNVVTVDGVAHVVGVPWDPETAVVVAGSTVCLAAAAARDLEGRGWLQVTLDLHLQPTAGPLPFVAVDADGLPALEAGGTWPLEGEG